MGSTAFMTEHTLIKEMVAAGLSLRDVVDLLEREARLSKASIVSLDDDFFGAAALAQWTTVDVGDATEAMVADGPGGQFMIAIVATSEAEDAVLYMGNYRNFDVSLGTVVNILAKAVTPGTGVTIVWGLAGDHNLDKDTVAEHAWFRLDASLALDVETDDTTNDNDDVTTGITLVTDTFYLFSIDFTDLSDVKFYVNGAQVAATTTFDMSNLATTENRLQPYFSADKASGENTGSLTIDRILIAQERV